MRRGAEIPRTVRGGVEDAGEALEAPDDVR